MFPKSIEDQKEVQSSSSAQMQTLVKLLSDLQMHTIVKLLGRMQSNYWADISSPTPPGFGTPASYATAMTVGETFDVDYLIKRFNA